MPNDNNRDVVDRVERGATFYAQYRPQILWAIALIIGLVTGNMDRAKELYASLELSSKSFVQEELDKKTKEIDEKFVKVWEALHACHCDVADLENKTKSVEKVVEKVVEKPTIEKPAAEKQTQLLTTPSTDTSSDDIRIRLNEG